VSDTDTTTRSRDTMSPSSSSFSYLATIRMQTRRRIQALPSSFNTRYRQQHVQSTYRQPSTCEARDALSVIAQLTYTRQALLRHCEIPCRVTIETMCRRDSERPDIDGGVPVPVRYHESGTSSLSVRMPSRALPIRSKPRLQNTSRCAVWRGTRACRWC
jgi:hypothetical protein